MFYAALDVSLRSVAICIIDEAGKVRLERSVHPTYLTSSDASTSSANRYTGSALKLARSHSARHTA
jgi:hypothetical protein